MTRSERIGLAAALAGALALRILLVVSLEGKPFFYVPIVDARSFDRWAADIATRSFLGDRVFFQDPLYAYGLGIFYKLVGHTPGALYAARIVQAVIGTAGLWMLFEAVRRLLGYRTAITALVLGALYKAFLFYDAMLLKDFLGVVAVEGALLAWTLENRWRWAAFGLALGLGSLVRGNMLLLIIAAAGFLLVRREWKSAGLALAGALAALAPVTIRNAAVGGEFVVSTSHFGVNLFIGNNPENTTGRYRPPVFLSQATPEFEESDFQSEAEKQNHRPMKPAEVDRYWRGRAMEYIVHHFATFVVVTLKRALLLISAFEIPDDHNLYFMERFSWVLRLPLATFGMVVLPLAAAGMYLSWPERGRFAMLYVLLASYALSIVFFFVFGRYRLPMVPILILFAAHAIVKTAQLVQWRMSALPKTGAAVFAATAIVANTIPFLASIQGHTDFRAAHYNLGVYYRENDRPLDAARELEEAAKLNPDYFKIEAFVSGLADCYDKGGDRPRALETLRRLSELRREDPEIPYRMGLLYYQERLYDRSSEMFEEAVRRDPNYGAAYGPLADAYRWARKPDRARNALDRGAAALHSDWSLRLKRAELYRELSMWKEALASAEEVLALKPNHPEALRIRDEARRKLR